MTTNRIDHTACSHPLTKTDREKCRKRVKAAALIDEATVEACQEALGTWNYRPTMTDLGILLTA